MVGVPSTSLRYLLWPVVPITLLFGDLVDDMGYSCDRNNIEYLAEQHYRQLQSYFSVSSRRLRNPPPPISVHSRPYDSTSRDFIASTNP